MGVFLPMAESLATDVVCHPRRAIGVDRAGRQAPELSSMDTGSRVRREPKLATIMRRAIEFGLVIVSLILLSPWLLLVAVLIKLTSRGPALFFQERVGRNGRVFRMLKFRTMRVDAEHATGPVWATNNDPRCTRVGAFLRRWSIDELPQLFNVLRGDMGLVGPRPERPFFVERFAREMPDYHARHLVRPGLTGWAQIHGWRGDTSLAERLKCDLYYVRERSLWLDAYILLRTPLVVLSARNAC
jgi:exopolysaccharide biosynthesis polyprenyl glycosylphosphotransferase